MTVEEHVHTMKPLSCALAFINGRSSNLQQNQTRATVHPEAALMAFANAVRTGSPPKGDGLKDVVDCVADICSVRYMTNEPGPHLTE